jgi:hypothetical protein
MSKGSRQRPVAVSQKQADDNFESIFGKRVPTYMKRLTEENNMTPSVEQMKKGTCGCGRSPTGDCCGWHGLSEDMYKQRKEEYETGKVDLAGNEVK